ncbi:MAG: hypothetical protein IIA64_10885 [Planctomycetes bacterium]|nr:hypothetical protein [Planctomycetota bacterium]
MATPATESAGFPHQKPVAFNISVGHHQHWAAPVGAQGYFVSRKLDGLTHPILPIVICITGVSPSNIEVRMPLFP